MSRSVLAVLVSGALVATAPNAVATSQAVPAHGYEVIDLLAAEPDARSMYPTAVNERGQVVGCWIDPPDSWLQPFRWTGRDGVVGLGRLGGYRDSCATGIDEDGRVVGHAAAAVCPTVAEVGFVWTRREGMRGVGVPSGCGPVGGSQAWAVRDGVIVGSATFDGAEGEHAPYHAFVLRRGSMTDLGVPPGFPESAAWDLNDRGMVVGFGFEVHYLDRAVAVVWEDGGIEPIATDLPGNTMATDVNDAGVVLGTAGEGAGLRHWTWTGTGGTRVLPVLPNHTETYFRELTDGGVVVGYAADGPWGTEQERAVTFDLATRRFTDLNDLLPAGSDWVLERATDMNERGQVVGVGRHGGRETAFLLTPPRCTIVGTQGNDELVGTSGDDVICGLAGHDDILGRGGDDVLIGGVGYDGINGGPGDDVINGVQGLDSLWGGAGRDRISGGEGTDQVGGGDGADVLWGGLGGDIIYGGPGTDRCDGGPGHDYAEACEG